MWALEPGAGETKTSKALTVSQVVANVMSEIYPGAAGALRSGVSGEGWSGKASWERWLLQSVPWEARFGEEESEEKRLEYCALENHTLFYTPVSKGLHMYRSVPNICTC